MLGPAVGQPAGHCAPSAPVPPVTSTVPSPGCQYVRGAVRAQRSPDQAADVRRPAARSAYLVLALLARGEHGPQQPGGARSSSRSRQVDQTTPAAGVLQAGDPAEAPHLRLRRVRPHRSERRYRRAPLGQHPQRRVDPGVAQRLASSVTVPRRRRGTSGSVRQGQQRDHTGTATALSHAAPGQRVTAVPARSTCARRQRRAPAAVPAPAGPPRRPGATPASPAARSPGQRGRRRRRRHRAPRHAGSASAIQRRPLLRLPAPSRQRAEHQARAASGSAPSDERELGAPDVRPPRPRPPRTRASAAVAATGRGGRARRGVRASSAGAGRRRWAGRRGGRRCVREARPTSRRGRRATYASARTRRNRSGPPSSRRSVPTRDRGPCPAASTASCTAAVEHRVRARPRGRPSWPLSARSAATTGSNRTGSRRLRYQ